MTRDGEALRNASGTGIVVAAEAGLAIRAFQDIADVVGEHAAHRVVRFVPSRAAAETWLGG